MGWSRGFDSDGREIGYGVGAICDAVGCTTEIDRGMAYRCGGAMQFADPETNDGCGAFCCYEHLGFECCAVCDSDEIERKDKCCEQLDVRLEQLGDLHSELDEILAWWRDGGQIEGGLGYQRERAADALDRLAAARASGSMEPRL